jgi:hypothetical protein
MTRSSLGARDRGRAVHSERSEKLKDVAMGTPHNVIEGVGSRPTSRTGDEV